MFPVERMKHAQVIRSNLFFHTNLHGARPINYLFHGSGRSVFTALGKINGHGLACMARQRLLGIATIVPYKHGIGVELKIVANRPLKKGSVLEVVISTASIFSTNMRSKVGVN